MKEKKKKEERRNKKTQGKNIMSASATQGGHKKKEERKKPQGKNIMVACPIPYGVHNKLKYMNFCRTLISVVHGPRTCVTARVQKYCGQAPR